MRRLLSVFFFGLVLLWLFCLPRELFKEQESAVLYARDSSLLGARITADGQWRFAASPADTVPCKFARALVCYEDKRFYSHCGVDLLALCRAVKQNLRSRKIVSGASTLTMQTIRLSRPGSPRTFGEKIIEAFLATRLEWRFTKAQILQLYASHAPFGGNVVGLEAAAWRYFGRRASQLSWAESALLAVLPNAPALMHLKKNRPLLLQKRNALLDRLCRTGVIDSLDNVLAKEEALPDAPRPMPNKAYHYLEYLRGQEGNRRFYSTLDASLQERVNATAARRHDQNAGHFIDNLAILVWDVARDAPIAYYGNYYDPVQKNRGGAIDLIRVPRSSGSTLKPFLYARMLDEGLILPTQLIPDIPSIYKDFRPRNYSKTYDGAVHADEVIERSLNVPAVRMLDNYGVQRFYELLGELGFTTINRGAGHYGLSLILGGAEITLVDLVKAYSRAAAALQNVGTGTCPLSPASLWITFQSLSRTRRPEEEADRVDFSSSRRLSWKTGTSWGNRDAWCIGVTPQYVVGVWVGNATGEGRSNLTGIRYAAPLMFDVWALLPPTTWFDRPRQGLEQIEICVRSGYPAGDACEEKQMIWAPAVRQGSRSNERVLPPACPYHQWVFLSSDGRYRVNSSCYDVSAMQRKSFFVLPPAMAWYYTQRHIDYPTLPPRHPSLNLVEEETPIAIVYPKPGTVIVTPLALDAAGRGAIFKAVHRDRDEILFWHLDGQYLGSTAGGKHQMLLAPEKGSHLLSLVDSKGAKASVRFRVQ